MRVLGSLWVFVKLVIFCRGIACDGKVVFLILAVLCRFALFGINLILVAFCYPPEDSTFFPNTGMS